jgi:hypothetical protein
MQRWLASGVLALATVAPAAAQVLYVPAVANVEGANQTRWRTDLQLMAAGDEPAAVTLELLESRRDNGSPAAVEVAVAAGESRRLTDLIASEFGVTGTGALRITATSGRILAASRTYNDDPAGTYGQTVPAAPEAAAIDFGDSATLIQLSRSPDPASGFRTNLGMLNLIGGNVTVTVELFRADGSALGTLSAELRPFEHRQLNDVFALAGAVDVGDGFAVVRTTTEEGRFLAYASVVDNGSGDAVFLLAGADDEPVPDGPRLVVFEALTRLGCPACVEAEAALGQLIPLYENDPVVIVQHDVDAPLAGRLDRWLAAYTSSGTIYLPLAMVDSGHDISNGPESYATVYAAMIDTALPRPASAAMAVQAAVDGPLLVLDVRLTNRSGTTLSAANGATLTALVYNQPIAAGAVPRVAAAAVAPITTLADGASADQRLEVPLVGLVLDRVRWVVIADYRPGGANGPFDTLQAMSGP